MKHSLESDLVDMGFIVPKVGIVGVSMSVGMSSVVAEIGGHVAQVFKLLTRGVVHAKVDGICLGLSPM